MNNEKMNEIKIRCNDFLIKLKHGEDTSDEFGKYTFGLNDDELKYCCAVFDILEAYHFGKISKEESKKRYDKVIKDIQK